MNLFEYTYCGNYNRQIQNLARIVPEKWSFGGNDDNGILKGYLEHTLQRVYEEEKLLETEEYAIFNTGLFNMYYQYSYEKDYLSEFSDQGEALDKLETGTASTQNIIY